MAMTQLTVADVGRLKVKDLQHELKKRGLATTGLKAELKQRLEECLQQQEGSDEKTAGDEVASEEPTRTAAAAKKSEGVDRKPVEEAPADSEGGKETSAPVEAETIGTSNERPTDHARSALEESTNEALRGKKRADEGTSDNVQSDDAGQAKGSNRKKQRVEGTNGRSGRKEKPAKRPETKEAAASEGDRDDGDRSMSLRIDNFRRPFTLGAVKSLVQELGAFVEDGFWMDAIKTHCYVTYADHDVAAKTMTALDGKVWPPESGIALKAAWSPSTAMEIASGPPRLGQTKGAAAKSREQASLRRHQKPVTIDEFFLKTTTKPVLYYLPLTDEQVEQRKVQQARQASRDANTRRQVQRS